MNFYFVEPIFPIQNMQLYSYFRLMLQYIFLQLGAMTWQVHMMVVETFYPTLKSPLLSVQSSILHYTQALIR